MKENKGHLLIDLLNNAVITRPIEEVQFITFDYVGISESLALKAWMEIQAKSLNLQQVSK